MQCKAGLIVLLTLASCINETRGESTVDYEDARRAAVEAWEEVIGRVSKKCYQRSIDAMVTETGRFPESCMPPLELGKYIGCYMPTESFGIGGDMIYIYEGRTDLQKMDTAVHEYGHLLHFCETGDGNPIDLELLAKCAAQIIADGKPSDRCLMPGDYFHLDESMWDDYGPDTVEAVGCAKLAL